MATCPTTGKLGYATPTEAALAQQGVNRRRRNAMGAVHIYRCLEPSCGAWHLGRPRPTSTNPKRRTL